MRIRTLGPSFLVTITKCDYNGGDCNGVKQYLSCMPAGGGGGRPVHLFWTTARSRSNHYVCLTF